MIKLKFVKHVLTLALFVLVQFQINAQCWYVEDNGGNTPDELCITDPPSCQDILYPDGTTPVTLIEALSIDPTGSPIYGADGGQVGILDIPTAVFTPYTNATGYSDIDGLAYDPFANILYATTRSSGLDSIFQVYTTGPNAGLPVPGTIVAVSGSGSDVDELAITPINCGTSGTIWASIRKSGGLFVLAKINPTTGVATEIGTGFGIADVESISFSGNCELYGNTGSGQVYLIDTTLGTVVGSALINVPGGDVEGMACDFGPGPFAGSIGGTIFADNNANGNNETEPGIGGVLLNLLDEFGNPVLDPAGNPITATTASDGSYIFDNLMGGDYIIQIDPSNILQGGPLDNDIQTYDEDGGTTSPNLEIPVILSGAGDHTTADFGFFLDASIGDTVVNDDTNAPIDGVIVYLLDDLGAIIDSATTANGGMYLFDSLYAMNYTTLVAPSNFAAGGALENMTNTTDPDGGLDDASMVTLLAGIDNLDQDYGYSGISSIGDTITNDDTNAPIDGVLVYLLDDMGAIIDSAITANGGMYLFDSLTAGDYVVEVAGSNFEAGEALENMTNTTDPDGGLDNTSAVTLAAGVDNLDQDFGYSALASIGDTITNDDTNAPIDGVLVYLLDDMGAIIDSAITATGGMYLFDSLTAGDYVVEVAALNFEAVGALENMTNTTDPDSGLDNTSAVTLAAGVDNLDQDFGYSALASIGDTITNDDTNAPIDGVLVYLLDDMGAIIDSAITANGGMYLFDSLIADDYVVKVPASNFEAGGALENMTNTTDPDSGLDNTSAVTLAAGVDNLDQDFGYTELGSITGTITDSNGAPLEGVELILFDANGAPVDTVLTIADGTYEFLDVAPGDYNVVETQPAGYTDVSEVDGGADADNPDNGIVNNIPVTVDAGEADAGNDFVELLANSSIGDMITDDQSGTGIDGVLVVLYDDMGVAIDSAITANGGLYLFENLTAATYTVVIDPSNFVDLGVLVGFNPTTDPQSDNNNKSLVVLGDNEENLADGDIGYTPIPLAVEFMSFDARPVDKHVELTWMTGSELNNDFFEVEHSIDGLSFNTIGNVQGNGTVSGISSYSFSHENTSSGRNFYRIKQVDYDGSYKYSEIRTINFKAYLDFNVYPTMTNSTLTVQFGTSVQDAKILIVSMNGSVVKSDVIDGSSATIAVHMLPAETYILYVQIGSEVMHKKFVKVD